MNKSFIKILISMLMICSSAEAQYNFSFVDRYALMHIIVNTHLKKIFDADAKRLRDNKVKSVIVGNDTLPEFEQYEINLRGFAENLITKNELYLKGESEAEYNIKYNVGGLISWIYYSPEQTELFYEHDAGKLSKIRSVSYDNMEYLALFYYKKDLPDSLYTESFENNVSGKGNFKIETDAKGFITNVFDRGKINANDTVFQVTKLDDSLLEIKSTQGNQKYMSFEIKDDKINSYNAQIKINNEVYIYKTDFYYKTNGLIDYINFSKSGIKGIVTHKYKYNYQYYD